MDYKKLLGMNPEALKFTLSSQFLAPNCDFYSPAAETTIRTQLARVRGIGRVRAYNIYMKAVNGTYTGPEMTCKFPPAP